MSPNKSSFITILHIRNPSYLRDAHCFVIITWLVHVHIAGGRELIKWWFPQPHLMLFTQNMGMCEDNNWLINMFTLLNKWAVNVLFRTLSDPCLNLNSAYQLESWFMALCVHTVSVLYPANTQIPRPLHFLTLIGSWVRRASVKQKIWAALCQEQTAIS